MALTFAPFAMFGAFLGGLVAKWVPATMLLLGFAAMMLIASISMWRGKREGVAEPKGAATHWLALEALVVGFITGMIGAGGGFIVVPVLLFFVGLDMKKAIGTSLVIIAAKSLAGFAGFAAHVSIDWKLAGAFVAFAIVGSFFGARLSASVDGAKLRKGFAVFIVLIAVFILGRELDLGSFLKLHPIAWAAITVGLLVNAWGLRVLNTAGSSSS